jgi:hypothetical protein
MPHHRSVQQLTPAARLTRGLVVALIGLLTALIIIRHPERPRAPLWVAIAACACFVIAGAAIALYGRVSARTHGRIIMALLLAMTCIPLWIAVGRGSRRCLSNVAYLVGEGGCRAAFGACALLMLWVFVFGLVLRRSVNADTGRTGDAP